MSKNVTDKYTIPVVDSFLKNIQTAQKVQTGERVLGNCLERGRKNIECISSQWAHFKCAFVNGVTRLDAVKRSIHHHFYEVTWDSR